MNTQSMTYAAMVAKRDRLTATIDADTAHRDALDALIARVPGADTTPIKSAIFNMDPLTVGAEQRRCGDGGVYLEISDPRGLRSADIALDCKATLALADRLRFLAGAA